MIWVINFLILVAVGKVQEIIPGTQYAKPVALALLVGILGHFIFRKPPAVGFVPWRRPFLFWILFSIGLVLSIPLGLWPMNSINLLVKKYGTNAILLFLVAWHLSQSVDLEKTTRVLLVAVLLLGMALFLIPDETIDWDGRIRASIGETYDPNDLALLVVMSVPFGVFWLWGGGLFARLFAVATLAVSMGVIYKTGSRGGMLSLGFVIVYCTLFVRQIGVAFRGILAAGILVGGLAATQTTTFQSLISGIQGKDYNASSEEGRVQIAIRGIGYAVQRPLWGVGVFNFQTAEGLLSGRGGSDGTGIKWSTAHNSYVEVLAENGFVTFGFFMLMLLSSLRELGRQQSMLAEYTDDAEVRRVQMMGSMVRCSLYAYMLGGFLLSMGYFPMLYLIIGYTLALGNITDSLISDIEADEMYDEDDDLE